MTHTNSDKCPNDGAVTGIITGTQRFSLHDGPGIRTIVFLKGCPLRCLWCHNPETHTLAPEILYDPARCLGCGACVGACDAGCHTIRDGLHVFDRTACRACGRCADACVGALELCGKQVTVGEALAPVLADRAFYKREGGLTLSGGEPFAQPAFTLALLRAAKKEGIRTAVETCGFADSESILAAAPYVDLFLYDSKECDDGRHRQYTGQGTDRILENLALLSDAGASIVLRLPTIPGLNDSEERFRAAAALADKYRGILAIDILPYHRAGNVKYGKLGRDVTEYPVPTKENVRRYLDAVQKHTDKAVRIL